MALEHQRIADQIRGQLQGAEHERDVAWSELMAAEAKHKKAVAAADELKLILEYHDEAVPRLAQEHHEKLARGES